MRLGLNTKQGLSVIDVTLLSPGAQAPYEVFGSNTNAAVDETVELTLAPANQAFCYLTSLAGKFDGAGETADLSIRSGSWVLQTRSSGTDDCSCGIPLFACGCISAKPLRAIARCIDIHQ